MESQTSLNGTTQDPSRVPFRAAGTVALAASLLGVTYGLALLIRAVPAALSMRTSILAASAQVAASIGSTGVQFAAS